MCWDRLIEFDADTLPARHLVPRDAEPVRSEPALTPQALTGPTAAAPEVPDELAVVA